LITCAFEDVSDVSKALEDALGEAENTAIVWRPQNTTPVDGDKAGSLMKLIGVLDDDDDIQNVYANFEIDEEVLASLEAS